MVGDHPKNIKRKPNNSSKINSPHCHKETLDEEVLKIALHTFSSETRQRSTNFSQTQSRGNKGTERDIEGVGWDMSIPLKLFLVLDGNRNLFSETSARSATSI